MEALDLHSRFVACAGGEIWADFLSDDVGCCRKGLDEDIGLIQKVGLFDNHIAYQKRAVSSEQ